MSDNEDISVEIVKGVIESLPHSPSRVPYTYHHDYLRSKSLRFRFSSRAEVADLTRFTTELEFYCAALCQVIEECTWGNALDLLSIEQLGVVKKAKKIALSLH